MQVFESRSDMDGDLHFGGDQWGMDRAQEFSRVLGASGVSFQR